MAKNYNWRIKREYYNLINNGIKTLEVRVGYPDIKRVQKGDTITFKDYSNIKFEVIRVTRYEDFPDMLDNEDSSKAKQNTLLDSTEFLSVFSLYFFYTYSYYTILFLFFWCIKFF